MSESPDTGDPHVRFGRFCKQPLEVGENIRDERGPPRVFGGWRLCKQDQKITGLGHGFTPAGGRCGEKNVQFLLAHPQRGVGGVDRGELTAHPGRLLRGHPSPTVQIDCVFRQICPLSAGCRSTGRNPSGRSRAFTSTPRRAPALVGFDH